MLGSCGIAPEQDRSDFRWGKLWALAFKSVQSSAFVLSSWSVFTLCGGSFIKHMVSKLEPLCLTVLVCGGVCINL